MLLSYDKEEKEEGDQYGADLKMFSRVGKQTNNLYLAFNKGHSLYMPPEHDDNEFDDKPTIQQVRPSWGPLVVLWEDASKGETQCKKREVASTQTIPHLQF